MAAKLGAQSSQRLPAASAFAGVLDGHDGFVLELS